MEKTRIVIHGVMGKMGCQILSSLAHNAELEIVGAVDLGVTQDYLIEPGTSPISLSTDLADIIKKTHPQVVIDFTNREATMVAMRTTLNTGVGMVIGQTSEGK
jgi:4-hydroxy-tetrahydrodipicolinate reductase